METQRIALFGAATQTGQRILNEALKRGHSVTAFVNDSKSIAKLHPHLKVVQAEVTNKQDIHSRIKGHDVAISAYHVKTAPHEHLSAILSLVEAIRGAGINRFIATGHPGSKEREPLIPTPATAETWRSVAETESQVLAALENQSDLRWSYFYYPEIQIAIKNNNRPVVGNEMLARSSETEHWFKVEKCAQNVINEAEHHLQEH